jgi:hypothetical protein
MTDEKPIQFQMLYNPATRAVMFQADPAFPIPDLINGLFTALLAYGSMNLQAMMQSQAQQQGKKVVGPDGMPLPPGR